MEKLFAGLAVVIVVLGFSCGFLLYQLGEMQSRNSALKSQASQLDNQLVDLVNQTRELEGQIEELKKQLEENLYQKKLSDAKQVQIAKTEYSEWLDHSFVMCSRTAYVTVKNYGTSDVAGLTLGTSTMDSKYREPLGLLKSGQSKTVSFVESYMASEESRSKKYNIMLGDEIVYP